jgi:Fur family ferric uptake transcriptional regulator
MSEDKNLRKAGLKVTLPRVRILEIFEQSSERHLSADDVYKKIIDSGDEVGLATVYRVLTQFESAGILMKQNFESGNSVYELSSNPNFAEHHDHMVCIKTGKVIEFNDQVIEEIQEKLADSHGYKLIDHKLVLYVEPKKENEQKK